MIPAPAAALLLLAATDPCGPVAAAAVADPASAAAYRAVGDEEASAGSRAAAALAYARAAALDPDDQASRAALRRVCAPGGGDPARAAIARMDAGDLRGAAALLRAARARDDDPDLALLEGICRYELGEAAAAEPLLRAAERAPEDADVARLYLGLLALRDGQTVRAASLFERAAESDALSATAWDLARAARLRGRWGLTLFAESGWDSNVSLAPPEAATSSDADALYGFGAAGVVRPLGAVGPYLRAQGVLTRQVQLDAYDVSAAEGAAGWALRTGRWSALAEYEYAYRTFGGSALRSSHQGLASASVVLGGATLGATYLARREAYASAFEPFSGTVQGAELRGAVPLGRRARLALGYGVALDAAREAVLSWVEHGPRAELLVAPSRSVRLVAIAAGTFRRYDAFDAVLGARRDDVYLDGEARVEWDVTRRWSVRAGVRARRALSNVASLDYDRMVPTVGLACAILP